MVINLLHKFNHHNKKDSLTREQLIKGVLEAVKTGDINLAQELKARADRLKRAPRK